MNTERASNSFLTIPSKYRTNVIMAISLNIVFTTANRKEICHRIYLTQSDAQLFHIYLQNGKKATASPKKLLYTFCPWLGAYVFTFNLSFGHYTTPTAPRLYFPFPRSRPNLFFHRSPYDIYVVDMRFYLLSTNNSSNSHDFIRHK